MQSGTTDLTFFWWEDEGSPPKQASLIRFGGTMPYFAPEI